MTGTDGNRTTRIESPMVGPGRYGKAPLSSRLVSTLLNGVPGALAARCATDSVAAHMFRPIVNRLLSDRPTEVTVRSGQCKGARLLIHPQTEKFYWTGLHEPRVQEAIASSLEPGMIFWDVGAHIGFMSVLASRLVGPSGTVRAFEPAYENRERLTVNLHLNAAWNVVVESYALSASGGSAELYRHKATLMRTLVSQRGEGEGEPVVCRTLDEVLVGAPPPHLIKVDVEGLELEVLRGGVALLAVHHPKVLVEFSDDDLVREAQRLLPDYAFQLVGQNHWLLK